MGNSCPGPHSRMGTEQGPVIRLPLAGRATVTVFPSFRNSQGVAERPLAGRRGSKKSEVPGEPQTGVNVGAEIGSPHDSSVTNATQQPLRSASGRACTRPKTPPKATDS